MEVVITSDIMSFVVTLILPLPNVGFQRCDTVDPSVSEEINQIIQRKTSFTWDGRPFHFLYQGQLWMTNLFCTLEAREILDNGKGI